MPKNKDYLSLAIWIITLIMVGSLIGFFTKPGMGVWYSTLNRSSLTPPNYVFPVAWTILYTIIGACGWLIWRAPWFQSLSLIKSLYITNLALNWSWTPLFFSYHLISLSLISLVVMNIAVGLTIYLGYTQLRSVSLLMVPYLLWILFATHLSFYIWKYN